MMVTWQQSCNYWKITCKCNQLAMVSMSLKKDKAVWAWVSKIWLRCTLRIEDDQFSLKDTLIVISGCVWRCNTRHPPHIYGTCVWAWFVIRYITQLVFFSHKLIIKEQKMLFLIYVKLVVNYVQTAIIQLRYLIFMG